MAQTHKNIAVRTIKTLLEKEVQLFHERSNKVAADVGAVTLRFKDGKRIRIRPDGEVVRPDYHSSGKFEDDSPRLKFFDTLRSNRELAIALREEALQNIPQRVGNPGEASELAEISEMF